MFTWHRAAISPGPLCSLNLTLSHDCAHTRAHLHILPSHRPAIDSLIMAITLSCLPGDRTLSMMIQAGVCDTSPDHCFMARRMLGQVGDRGEPQRRSLG